MKPTPKKLKDQETMRSRTKILRNQEAKRPGEQKTKKPRDQDKEIKRPKYQKTQKPTNRDTEPELQETGRPRYQGIKKKNKGS